MFKCYLVILLFTGAACHISTQPAAPQAAKKIRIIALQPFEETTPDAIAFIQHGLADSFDAEVTILPAAKLPQNAWYAARKRYWADSILAYLRLQHHAEERYVLAVTGKDIATAKGANPNWGVMGLGLNPGKYCVISDYRLQRDRQTKAQLHFRLLKVALHEMGHNFGLAHCPNPNCIMVDAEGKDKLDDEKGFCEACRKKL